MFHDRAVVHARGGRGGDGSVSFRREKFVPKGGPDGGDGGNGGDVVLVASAELRDLSTFRFRQHLRAERGRHGEGSARTGREGEDAVIAVRVGTQVRGPAGILIVDLAHDGARAVVARGGLGGRGNRNYATPTHQAPRMAQVGLDGDEIELELRLKIVCDAALLGFPNAGKSSLLRRISNARPKVAYYPFTTVEPVLGTVDSPDGTQLTVADVPGLLEGASQGVGLGDEFLAHLERARLLIHLVEAAPDAANVRRRLAAIDRELELHGGGLAERPQLIVLSKIDLIDPAERAALIDAAGADLSCSSATGEGIDDLVAELFSRVPQLDPADLPQAAAADELADYLVYRPRPAERRAFRVLRDDGTLRLAGRSIEALAAELDPEDPRDASRLAAELERLDVEPALRNAGARPGDDVLVGPHRLSYQPSDREQVS